MLVVKYSESIELKKKKEKRKRQKDLNTLKISCFVKNAFFLFFNKPTHYFDSQLLCVLFNNIKLGNIADKY